MTVVLYFLSCNLILISYHALEVEKDILHGCACYFHSFLAILLLFPPVQSGEVEHFEILLLLLDFVYFTK